MSTDREESSWLGPDHEPGLVSVIIPTFNREKLLAETLETVFRQDYRPVEIIVVDDGSTDGTLEMLGDLKPPEGITLRVIAGEHAGAAAARNRGAGECRGEFIMFHDSDDIMHEGALTALVEGLGEADLVFGMWRDWFSSEDPPRFGQTYERAPSGDFVVDLLRNDWLLPSAVLHRRSSLLRCDGWDETFTLQDDFAFMARVALSGAKSAAVRKLVNDYRRHQGDQLSKADASAKLDVTRNVLRQMESALGKGTQTEERRDALAWRWFFEARLSWLYGMRSRFVEFLGEARRVQPGFRPPKAWYRMAVRVGGYAFAERVGAIGRLLFRRRS